MNIVSLAMQYLTPALIARLATGLGIDHAVATKMVKAALPVILGSLASKTGNPEGARALFDMLTKQDTGLLGRLSSVLGGPQQATVADQGSNALGSLLGPSALGSLVGAVSQFSGATQTAASNTVGMLAPIALGTLRQQQKSSNLDAGGVAKLLADQASNIAAAIPTELTALLAGTGLLDAVTVKTTTRVEPSTGRPPAPKAGQAAEFNGWAWAVLIAAASVLWSAWFSGTPTPWAAVPAPPRLIAGSTDVSGELDVALKSLHSVLSTVKDKTSAEAALPRLKNAQTTVDRLDGAAQQLPLNGRRLLADHVASWLPVITPVITSALGNANVSPIVKPTLDEMRRKIEALAKA